MIVEVFLIFIGFSAGVILEWFCFMGREQKLKGEIQGLKRRLQVKTFTDSVAIGLGTTLATKIFEMFGPGGKNEPSKKKSRR